jgi:hypothetical protein
MQAFLNMAGEGAYWWALVSTWFFLLAVLVAGLFGLDPGWLLLAHLLSLVVLSPSLVAQSVRLWPWRQHPRRIRVQACLSALYPVAVLASGWFFA